ncbi:hypothetical protein QJS10_CPB15g00935 [Acorus calamus]|uniref:PGG domain-containing protein n=1 Tax=Acorus calamus TaxID=4465 RepID=A0AAV9D697_ACOCL|nr:hypothetical protein QJS10_CPB15g00935 [Acorus calamus]
MDPRLYRSAMLGDAISLRKLVEEDQMDLTRQLTPQENNALHIAAKHGRSDFAEELLRSSSLSHSLLFKSNSDGDLPLHMASREGHVACVNLFINSMTRNSTLGDRVTDLESNNGAASAVWLKRNSKGNTALHESLRFCHANVTTALLELDPGFADSVNLAGESALYLASEVGMTVVVDRILSRGSSFSLEGPNGRTPLHASAIGKHFDITELLLDKLPDLINKVDMSGRNALHYAASTAGFLISQLLVQKDRSLSYVKDDDGLAPFFVAIQFGHIRTTCMILDHCLDVGELRDTRGRNALHMAIKNNTMRMLRAVLKRPELGGLVNEPDNDGNTPLHVATKDHLYTRVKLMLAADGVDVRARNKEGLTALDISEHSWELSFRQKFIRQSLLHRGAVRRHFQSQLRMRYKKNALNRTGVDLKSYTKTVSLVATLLATISFAAAFTMPGGYNSDGPNKGYAILIKRSALKAFLLSDTVTFCSSLALAVLMTWGTLGDLEFLRSTAIWSQHLLKIAFYGSLVTFGTGVYAVISDECLWLAIVVCLMVCSIPFICRLLITGSSIMTPYAAILHAAQLEPLMEQPRIVQNAAITGQ